MEKIKEDAHAKINIKYIGRDKPGGKIIYSHETHNTVCDLYYDLIADRMAGGTDTLISYGHCGTSTGQRTTAGSGWQCFNPSPTGPISVWLSPDLNLRTIRSMPPWRRGLKTVLSSSVS